MARGEPVLEKLDDEKVLVWPDLVYTELICMVIATFVLIVWAILLKAPLEQPATTRQGAEPVEGAVVLPRPAGNARLFRSVDGRRRAADMIIIGLVAMPYIDFNREGNGYYTFNEALVRHHDVHVRLPGAVGDADRAGHLPARAELELLRAVRVLGSAQGAAAEQRQRVGACSGCNCCIKPLETAMQLRVRARAAGHRCWCSLYLFAAAAAAGPDGDAQVLHQDGFRPLHGAGRR